MIWLVIGVLAVLVVVAIVWSRVDASRSAHKSVETYERGIGALGQISKRTQSTGFRILPHEEAGRPHVGRRIDRAGGEAPADRENVRLPGQDRLAPSRLPPAGEPKLRFSRPGRPPESASAASPQAGDKGRDDREAGAVRGALPATASGVAAQARLAHARGRVPGRSEAGARGAASRSRADRRRQVMTRRVATGATAGAAVVAVVVAAVFLSGGGGHHPTTSTTTTLRRGGGGRTTTTTTTFPTTLKPTSVSPTNVAFTVPSGGYSLAFQATGGSCWVGIEHTRAGPWLFAETLSPGQAATYKGSGALVITFGAPAHIGFTMNGLVAELPSGVTQPYSVELTPPSG
ncbi:MAG: hypothetical protein WAV54_09440 [Acidimicrobiales bacterium]